MTAEKLTINTGSRLWLGIKMAYKIEDDLATYCLLKQAGVSPNSLRNWYYYFYLYLERECLDYGTLHSADRSSLFQLPLGNSAVCDNNIAPGWYRFLPPAGVQMASSCVPSKKCATSVTGWLKSTHPKMTDGIVSGTVCYSWDVCCQWSQNIRVRNCGRFYVYDLKPTISCPMRFCGQ